MPSADDLRDGHDWWAPGQKRDRSSAEVRARNAQPCEKSAEGDRSAEARMRSIASGEIGSSA
jgi:hypothetical protein